MITRLLTRTSILGIIGSLAWLSSLKDTTDSSLEKTSKKYENIENAIPKTVANFDELRIFEKQRGCKYIFFDTNNKKEIYDTENALKKVKNKYPREIGWWESIPKSVWTYRRNLCGRGKVVALDAYGNQMKELK